MADSQQNALYLAIPGVFLAGRYDSMQDKEKPAG